jgi:ferrochelatase
MSKTAIILFNLGGPDRPEAVKPFLYNLFNDPAIIQLPGFLRRFVANLISTRREKTAQDIYAKIGGHSPILINTQRQAEALQSVLTTDDAPVKCFIAMRYWHPFVDEIMDDVKDFAPDRILLLPLYPQFSTTTTGSSVKSWHEAAAKIGLNVPTTTVCCYPDDPGFVKSVAALTRAGVDTAKAEGKVPRVLFSAHGLPEKIIRAGDPYQYQCEQTVAAIVKELAMGDLDYTLCYQSRVGPLKWIGPATDTEIRRAGAEQKALVVVPIAFVSDHSETLVEIDMEYRHLATECGVPFYAYAGTVSVMPDFIDGLATIAGQALLRPDGCCAANGTRICPKEFSGCPCRLN